MLTQARLHMHATQMLPAIAEAASPKLQPRRSSARSTGHGLPSRIQADLRQAEYGQWAGFYTLGDWFVDVPLTLRLAEVCRSYIAGRPLSPAEQQTLATAVRINRENTSYVFIKIKEYQEGQKVKFSIPRVGIDSDATGHSLPRDISTDPSFSPLRGRWAVVCHCFAEAVLDVTRCRRTACSKQWHTAMRNAD